MVGGGRGLEGERYGSFFLADWTIGLGLGKASGVLASGTKFRGTPRNSVINRNDILLQYLKKLKLAHCEPWVTTWFGGYVFMGTRTSPILPGFKILVFCSSGYFFHINFDFYRNYLIILLIIIIP